MKNLFTNAAIYSPDKLRGDCIAVDNGMIAEIGPKNRLIHLKRHGFKVIDLNGKTILPGIIDSHLHLMGTAYHLVNINLDNIDSLEKALATIGKAAEKARPRQWLLGRGWNKNIWHDGTPDSTALNKICPNNPIRLFSKDGHTLWVNSMALKVCGIDNTTPDPDGGTIQRDSDGRPTGILFENACDLIVDKIPGATTGFKLKVLKKAVKMLNSHGITGVCDCDWDDNRLSLFSMAREKDILNLRICMMLSPDDIDSAVQLGLKSGFGDSFITLGGLKLYMDGALGSQTGWMHEPYENQPNNFGIPAMSDDELEMNFEKTHLNGISLAVHAIGDKANTELLEFFGKKLAVSRKLKLNHRIEHAQILRTEDLEKFKRYNVAAGVQPIHLIGDRDMAEKQWGIRSRYAYPFGSLLKKGAVLGFGSDCPIEDPNPFMGIYAAVARKHPKDDRPAWYGQECITVKEAVRAYTEGSARICGWQGKSGVIAPGAKADFTVISDNIFKIKIDQIPQVKALATIVDGRIVYKDKAFKV
ncbi:MAG: amidohydrolase [candidate division Zixibacteria bacterium]|nr:amidohydrolase [candidate division Zixibacteria bacterium]